MVKSELVLNGFFPAFVKSGEFANNVNYWSFFFDVLTPKLSFLPDFVRDGVFLCVELAKHLNKLYGPVNKDAKLSSELSCIVEDDRMGLREKPL